MPTADDPTGALRPHPDLRPYIRADLARSRRTIATLQQQPALTVRKASRLRNLINRVAILDEVLSDGELEVDPSLEHLPLLDIAGEVARRYDSLKVWNVDLQHAHDDMTGLTVWRGPWGLDVRILLDVDHIGSNRYDLERIWAHELSHAIDCLDTRVHMRNGRRRDVNRREDFADGLAAWMLEEPRLTSLAEVRRLVPQLRRALRSGEIRIPTTTRLVPDPERTRHLEDAPFVDLSRSQRLPSSRTAAT